MSHYIVYKTSTGEIVKSGSCPSDMVDNQALDESETSIETDMKYNDELYWFDGEAIVARPDFDIGITGDLLSNVPAGTVLEIEGQTYTADGTDIELGFNIPGKYHVKFKMFPYKPKTLEVII